MRSGFVIRLRNELRTDLRTDLRMRTKLRLGIFVLSLLPMIFLSTGCAQQTAGEVSQEKPKRVKVLEVKEDTLPVRLKYTGMTSSGEMKKYSFKVPGKLTEVKVEKGSPVQAGQTLATVSTTELSLDLEHSELTLQKAEKAYTEAKDTYAKLEKLFQAGALSEDDLTKAKLDLDVKEASYNQAKIGLESKKLQLNDAALTSDMDGYVVDVLNQEGEIIAAGYPVVVVRAGTQEVTVGLSQSDVSKIKVGTVAHVTLDGQETQGQVTRIDAVPDSQSRTYNTVITLSKPFPEDRYYLGATAQVEFELGGVKGIWVPLASVLNDGEDYVFVIEAGRAVKKNLKLLDVQSFNVRVEGLAPGDQLVTTGMKALKEGTKVQVQSEEDSLEGQSKDGSQQAQGENGLPQTQSEGGSK